MWNRQVVRGCILFLLVSAALPAQSFTQLGALEYQPQREFPSRRAVARRPRSFEFRLPPAVVSSLGSIRREEMDAVPRNPRLKLRGIERTVDSRVRETGQWVILDDGTAVWRMAVQSEGAAAIRVEFSSFSVGTGQVWFYSADHNQVSGPYTGSGPDETGTFWSHMVFQDQAVVEYQPDGSASSDGGVPLVISKVAHLLPAGQQMSVPFLLPPFTGEAGSCELDVSCYPDWRAIASGVGLYYVQMNGGMWACTGSLVNNSNQDRKPYFLTANHCIWDQATARTVEVFWNYQTASCNGARPDLASLPTTLGATYLTGADSRSGDYSLLLLSPLPDIPLTFYGSGTLAPSACTIPKPITRESSLQCMEGSPARITSCPQLRVSSRRVLRARLCSHQTKRWSGRSRLVPRAMLVRLWGFGRRMGASRRHIRR